MRTGVPTRSRLRLLERDAVAARPWERIAAIPAWAWLVALVVVSFCVRLALSLDVPAPWIFPDEVTYAELSRSFVDSGTFAVRETPVPGFSRIYPILIAPAFALFDDQASAYAAAKAINALLMSLAAIPVYFLARRLVRPGLALVAAALSLAIPSLFYSSLIMTEAAFYPLFVLFALALVLMLERPTAFRQVAVVALLVVAYYTRTQAVFLAPAIVTATGLHALMVSRSADVGARLRAFWRELLAFRLVWLAVAAGVVAAVVFQTARGRPIEEWFGAYESVATAGYDVAEVARWFLYDLIDIDLAFGVVPLAALVLLLAMSFRQLSSRRERAFSASAVSLVFWLLLIVAMFQSTTAPRLEERFLFYAAPLLFVALAAWVGGWQREDRRLVTVAAVVACALPLAFSYGRLLRWDNVADSFGLWPLNHLLESGYSVGEILVVVVFGLIACGLAFVLLRGAWRLAVPAFLLVVLSISSAHVDGQMAMRAKSALDAGITLDRTWIDDAVGPGGTAVSLWSGESIHAQWQNEFFSKRLGKSYYVTFAGDGLPSDQLTIAPSGDLLDEAGEPVTAQYAVADRTYRLAGEAVAADPVVGTTVYRVDGPLRLDEYVAGMYPDRYSGPTLEYTRWSCPGGTLDAALTQNALLIDRPQTIVAIVDGNEVARTTIPPTAIDLPLHVPVTPDSSGACRVTFRVSPTAVPDDVLGNGDVRELGVQFTRLELVPSG